MATRCQYLSEMHWKDTKSLSLGGDYLLILVPRGEMQMARAAVLNVTVMYMMVRHPLYLLVTFLCSVEYFGSYGENGIPSIEKTKNEGE
jgi:hypothetical protein